MEEKSVEEVCDFLRGKGVSASLLESFRGYFWALNIINYSVHACMSLEHELDGNAILIGMASGPGAEWLREVVPSLGARLNVYDKLRSLVQVSCVHQGSRYVYYYYQVVDF